MSHLVPQPKSIKPQEGVFAIQDGTRIFLTPRAERPEYMAATQLQRVIQAICNRRVPLDRPGSLPVEGPMIHLAISDNEPAGAIEAQGYTLKVEPAGIRVTGNSSVGLFNGIQTLQQLFQNHAMAIPAMDIEDVPALEVRGFYHDVSRGKVPRLSTLKWLVDYLALHKINQFQLYIEHPFHFRFDPAIAQDSNPLTSDDILELQEYCIDRRIEFVPSLQAFGHMGGVLALPQYKHLADVELKAPWKDLNWRERMRGATIDSCSEEARALLEKMFDAYLPLFNSDKVNFCADETYDLGEGKNRDKSEKVGKGRLYVDHILWLREAAARHGKQLMIWGDILLKHPELVPELPKDIVLMNWGYEATHDYESTKVFAEAGLTFYCCPGVGGWNRVLNDVENATVNIVEFTKTAVKYGATGLLNTDWGDHGHYNPLAASLHGIALGAAVSWNTETSVEEFDKSWSVLTFNDPLGKGIDSLRKQSQGVGTWIILYTPFVGEPLNPVYKAGEEEAHRLIREGIKGRKIFQDYFENRQGESWITAELAHGSKMNVLVGEKILLWKELEENGHDKPNPELAERLEAFASRVAEHYHDYQPLWLARNRPCGLPDIRSAVERLVNQSVELAERLRG